ncbi:MAG: hypothetical protein ACFB4I_06985 [Cyanophyceae cyanobacterium]
MRDLIPTNTEEIMALRQESVDEEIVAAAIAGVVEMARREGQSLDELTAEVLKEDCILDRGQRCWLSNIVTQAWTSLPS